MVYPEINENKYATNRMSVIIPPKKQKIVQFNYVPSRNPVFVETKISHPSTPLVLKVNRTFCIPIHHRLLLLEDPVEEGHHRNFLISQPWNSRAAK